MKFTPKKNKKGSRTALALAIFGSAFLILSCNVSLSYGIYLQLASGFLFLLSFEVFYRYELTVFTYYLDEKHLVITKTVGKKSTCVCDVELCDAVACLKKPTRKEKRRLEQEYGKLVSRYNRAQTRSPKAAYSVFFLQNGKLSELILEPSEEMVGKLAMKIAENEL